MKNEYLKPVYIKHKISNIITITKIATVYYLEYDKNFDFPLEVHNFWEMIYIDGGHAQVVIKDKTYELGQGDIFFVKPNFPHKLCADGKNSFNAFIISFTSNSGGMHFFQNKILNVPLQLRKYIALIMNECENVFVFKKNNPDTTEMKLNEIIPLGSVQMIRSYLEQFLILLLRGNEEKFPNLFTTRDDMENHIILSVKNILKDNIYGNITVEEICNNLHYSRTYIAKVFRQNCGTTVNNFYNDLKIKEAKKLIRGGNHNFTQISDALGFNNSHYFTRVFKRVTNMTPTEYKNSSSLR